MVTISSQSENRCCITTNGNTAIRYDRLTSKLNEWLQNDSKVQLILRLNNIAINFLTSEYLKDVQNYIFSKTTSHGLSEWLVGFKVALLFWLLQGPPVKATWSYTNQGIVFWNQLDRAQKIKSEN